MTAQEPGAMAPERLAEVRELSGNVRVGDLGDYDGQLMPHAVTVGRLVDEIERLKAGENATLVHHLAEAAKIIIRNGHNIGGGDIRDEDGNLSLRIEHMSADGQTWFFRVTPFRHLTDEETAALVNQWARERIV